MKVQDELSSLVQRYKGRKIVDKEITKFAVLLIFIFPPRRAGSAATGGGGEGERKSVFPAGMARGAKHRVAVRKVGKSPCFSRVGDTCDLIRLRYF